MCGYHYRRWYRASGHVSSVQCVECGKPAVTRQLCSRHYQRAKKVGASLPDGVRARSGGRCSIEGCDQVATLRGLCRPHYRHEHRNRNGVTFAVRLAYHSENGGRCDLCQEPLQFERSHLDHDHGCCRGNGCVACVRGLLCLTCNHIEGMVRSAIAMGIVDSIEGPLARYLADPPMRRWLGRAMPA